MNCYARLITEEKTTLSFSVPVRQCLSLYLKNSKNKNSLNSVSQLIFTFYLSIPLDFPQNKHKVLNGVLQLRPYTQVVHTKLKKGGKWNKFIRDKQKLECHLALKIVSRYETLDN